MNSLDQKRKERARNGSRRQRDLEATGIDWPRYVAEHFPGEHPDLARLCAEFVHMAKPPRLREVPDPEAVRERMRSKGYLREQQEASP